MTKVLELESVMAGYGDVPVLWGVSAYVERNETVAIVGANGAGKTTVVRAVCGLVRAWDGRITKNGVNIAGMSPPERVAQGIAVRISSSVTWMALPPVSRMARSEEHTSELQSH